MKYGQLSSKELSEYFQERSNMEEVNGKAFSKLAKQTTSCCGLGTFAPLWVILRTSAEKLSNLHLQMFQKLAELVKEMTKYTEELHKKHRTVKEEESRTLEIVRTMHTITQNLQKAKENYQQKSLELEKLKKENGSPKDIEKSEMKFKKSQEDYKTLIGKYGTTKVEFEEKMTQACKHFQELEEAHLKQMKQFLNNYAEIVESNHDSVGSVNMEFKRKCVEMTVDKLLEQFVLNKYTGLEKPEIIEFEEATVSSTSRTLIANVSPDSAEGREKESKTSRESSHTLKFEGFLKSRRRKGKNASKKKKENSTDSFRGKDDKSDGEEGKEDGGSTKNEISAEPEIDEEGYCIKPKVDLWDHEKGNFYSSGDSDSDDERERKIKVEIKPLRSSTAPLSASVDELRATVENILQPPAAGLATMGRRGSGVGDDKIKRSQSVSQQIGKQSNDLMALNLFQSPTVSSASTPTGNNPYAPLQSPPTLQSPTQLSSAPPSATSKYSELDVFSEVGEIQPILPPKQTRQTPTPTFRQTPTPTSAVPFALPRPPSRRSEGPSPRGRMSPSAISRTDSIGSLEFRTSGIPVGSSRGPSPLTIGISDTIPLAVAFHEICHCYFRGSDETKCQVKMSGDMMVSFPAGIVAVLAHNPSPALLSFRIKDIRRLQNITPNKQLVSIDSSQSSSDSHVFEFNMSALTSLLKKQAEQNPTASYFNVDILKYFIRPKSGASSCPFQLVAYWKCSQSHTDLKVDYKYNSHAMASPSPLLNLTVSVPVDGGVRSFQAKPDATWNAETTRAFWKFTELSQHSEGHGVGSLRARFELTNGPGSQGTIATQFNCEGTTLSGTEFELIGTGYRLSLVKRRFVSGKYICDGDVDSKYRYASPSSTEC
ncbi:proline-serine-threonine phosphatase interacting protein, putative [Pediculus humanus corporis]|uniref:Proline-serine-threonine phosphatase interacting protein, putative n=1 Tax=Pediculus humanus subsp. corporis TaxID=121224 RepID=E0VJW5_PEDHC|nr:proline-serine-threonine phosphatase interacting protein, putative [Pediculus humanus corporis]EEB13671.1 proline-serine-threonine phosphatase interacting protein, putative [Pediculus humanus corporis]